MNDSGRPMYYEVGEIVLEDFLLPICIAIVAFLFLF